MHLNNLKIVVERKEINLQEKVGKAGRDVSKLTGNVKSIGYAVNLESQLKGHLDPSLRQWKEK